MTNELHHDQILDSSIVEETELSKRGLSDTPFQSSLTISSVVSSTKKVTFASSDLFYPRVANYDILDITSGPATGRYFIDEVLSETELTVIGSILDDSTGTSVADIYYRSGACTVGFDDARDFGAEEHIGEAKYVARGNCVQTAIEDIGYKFWAQREPTGFCERTDTVISFDNSSRKFRIEAKSPLTHWHYYIRGILHEYDDFEEITIPDIEGIYFIYFENGSPSGTLTYSNTSWDFDEEKAFVAILYWDATNKKAVFFLEERHGCAMDWATHRRWHMITGSLAPEDDFIVGNYNEDGDGSLNSHVQFSLSNGILYDEDIDNVITHSDTPTEAFEQILTPVCYAHILYKSGVNGYFRDKIPNQYPIIEDGINTPKYNSNVGGNWSLVNVTDGWFFVMWLVVTNDRYYPVKMLTGIYQAPDLITAAQLNIWSEVKEEYEDILVEAYPLKKFIFEANTSFTNNVQSRLVAITDYFQSPALNDRYSKQFFYNGKAGPNKYLELYPGQSSLDSPFTLPENSFIRTITLDTTTLNTGVIGFYTTTDTVNPIVTITFNNQSDFNQDYSIYLSKNTKIFGKVISGSFSKPAISMYIQTDTF